MLPKSAPPMCIQGIATRIDLAGRSLPRKGLRKGRVNGIGELISVGLTSGWGSVEEVTL